MNSSLVGGREKQQRSHRLGLREGRAGTAEGIVKAQGLMGEGG